MRSMRYRLIAVLCFIPGIMASPVNAQQQTPVQHQKAGTAWIMPAVLIGSGLALHYSDVKYDVGRMVRQGAGADFRTHLDDYLPAIPAAQLLSGDLFGLHSANNIFAKATNVAAANALSGGVVLLMKNAFGELRPDGSDRKSFPSGHTAIAFTNASLLFHEYRSTSLPYALSGYAFAVGTAYLRMANNRHYISDVLTGAGIGMLAGTVVYFLNPGGKIFPPKKDKDQLTSITNPPAQFSIVFTIK